jgi:hypothetical protein
MKISPRSGVMFALVLTLALGVVAATVRQREIAGRRAEHEALAKDSEEAARLEQENRNAGQLRPDSAELEKLREENRDLPRLRSEVTQLRSQTKELESLRTEHAHLLTEATNLAVQAGQTAPRVLPANFVSRAALMDAGLASPEAAVQTVLWAITQGNATRFTQCLVPSPQISPQIHFMGQWSSGNQPEEIPSGLADQMTHFPGYAIAEKTTVSPSEVIISLQSSAGATVMPLKLRLVGNEWKLEQN